MRTFSPEYLHPVAKRSLESVRSHLHLGRSAFYLGAGVDSQLAKDARVSAPSWAQLISALHPFPEASLEETESFASDWPTETALVARLRLGEEQFKEQITQTANRDFAPDLSKSFSGALTKLLLKSNIIVTPNFTSHILKSLQKHIDDDHLDKEIIVLTREDLPSFQFPTAQIDPHRVFLIHIHGRCVERSNLVFDAWGYNVAVNDDPYYHRFLHDLFSYRSVIAIGTSWKDITLRNQAALVFRTQGYQRAFHISLNYQSSISTTAVSPNSVSREWANAMHAAYGVRMISVDRAKQEEVVQSLLGADSSPPDIKSLTEVAKFLDDCGDYESPSQQQWLVKIGTGDGGAQRIRNAVSNLYKRIILELSKNPNTSWKIAARIERHLRHFHYLYITPFTSSDNANVQLWDLLAGHINRDLWKTLEDQLRFDFLVAQYEIRGVKAPTRLSKFKVPSNLQERLQIARNIWSNKMSINERVRYAVELLDLGWEAMSAKLFLDAAMETARTAAKSPESHTARAIVDLAIRGGDVARSTGYFRREAKAQTLAAMWLPNPQEGRVRILSKIRAAEYHSNGGETGALVEPAIVSSLTAGLLASHIRTLDLHVTDKDVMDEKLKDSVEPLLMEAGIRWKDVQRNLLSYWEKVVDGNLRVYFLKAIQGDYIT